MTTLHSKWIDRWCDVYVEKVKANGGGVRSAAQARRWFFDFVPQEYKGAVLRHLAERYGMQVR